MSARSGQQHGTLYLIPVPLAADGLDALTPRSVRIIHGLAHFVVENARTARRFIKTTDPPYSIQSLTITEIGKHEDIPPETLLAPLLAGHDMGLMSEAGCPVVADPGSDLVRFAHERGIKVIPLAGPSSILMALMASGLGGQQFQFHGYLSPQRNELARALKTLESSSTRDQATQVFIETPYRNTQVVTTALEVLADQTWFTVAVDLTAETEWVRTMRIADWKKASLPDLHKRPAVFCLRAF